MLQIHLWLFLNISTSGDRGGPSLCQYYNYYSKILSIDINANMGTIKLKYEISANDFITAGEASSNVKNKLTQIGISADIIKKAAISMYEAEINAVIHGNGGYAYVEIFSDKVVIKIVDSGPGIPDVAQAMQEGYSTAPDNIREMGFGAGMGLPNMKRYADKLEIYTEVGKGTSIILTVNF